MKRSAVTLLVSFAIWAAAPAAQAQASYPKGPNPTLDSIKAVGPFAVSTQTLAGSGFARGTVYSPNTPGTYGLIAVCPGFMTAQNTISQISERLATHGFVVVTIDTNLLFDLPPSRATQLLAALRATAALKTGPVAGKIDLNRQAVAGWSMGGGGALIAARSTPGLKATVAFAPFATFESFASNTVPAAILGGTLDILAPPAVHAIPFYNAMPTSVAKLLGVIAFATHDFSKTASQPASYTEIAWMKRFVDNDARYSTFLKGDPAFSTFASTGPF